ncbi:MAG: SPFH domain-containing protein [Actinomycetaceae bacterium]|nr:SPFH domain-containing protein [Actinomycetaceae bacterium]
MTVHTSAIAHGDPVGGDQPGTIPARMDISEKPAASLGSAAGFLVLFATLALLILGVFGIINGAIAEESGVGGGVPLIIGGIVLILVSVIGMVSLKIVPPGQTSVIQFFGRYIGTLRRTGLAVVVPFSYGKKVSVKVHNFETNELKVNDLDGNPVNIAAIVVWQVADTARAVFAVEDYEEFVRAQAESALRHVASTHPYDEPGPGETSLRGGTEKVSAELAAEVAERVAIAGLEIVEVRISSLAYAPEIAQAMLQRQQADAVIAAREKIVEGAVTMVEQALTRLESEDIVSFDDERKAQMVSNLLVVLCSEQKTTPVINTGSLYA